MYHGYSFLLCVTVTSASWFEPTYYYQDGDVIIGGMFPLHTNVKREDNYDLKTEPSIPVCTSYFYKGFRWMQAFLFAIEEINNSTSLLPDYKLGYRIYDSCDTSSIAVTHAMQMVRDNRENGNSSDVKAVVGATSSDNSIAIAHILGVFDIPQISYGSTSRRLEDKEIYNSFLRTIPNDNEQATAIADLLDFYNWTWVGAIGGDDEYGRQGLAKFKQEASTKGICVEFEEYIPKVMDPMKLDSLVDRIGSYNATVFVLFISGSRLEQVAEKLNEKNITGKIWVASEAWATSRKVQSLGGSSMHGTLGIATRGGEMKGFREFLESVSPSTQSTNPFIGEFWEKTFQCSCTGDFCRNNRRVKRQIEVTTATPPCTGDEKFSDVPDNAYLKWTDSELEKSYTAYLAAYAIAKALENITKCKDGSGLLENGKCPEIETLEPWQLLTYLKDVRFQAPGLDEKFSFDSNGDPNATYKLISWFPVPNSTGEEVDFRHVGNYSKEKNPRWSLDYGAIYWKDGNGSQILEVPLSICSMPCEAGFYRVKLASECCHKCIPCPVGEFSNATNAAQCEKCEISEMAEENRTFCVPKPEDYMRWNDAFGITFTCCSALGILLTLFTAVVFFRHRSTAIVKATNVEISFLLFLSLIFCFLTPLVYIAKPEDWTCKGRQISFILSFTFCVACILVKTLRVLTAFKATLPLHTRKRSRFLGEHLQILVVVLVALIQVILCVTWLVIAPPKVSIDYDPFDRILILCDPGSLPLMISTEVYLAILALIAFVFAFRARKLPENFNEAKFITFSMLVFFIVWLSFIPAYLSTTGVMATALYCIGILASTFGILGCIFFPKLYIILVTPENNSTQRVRETTASHAFRAATKSVIYQINSDRKNPSNTLSTSLDVSRGTDGSRASPLPKRTGSNNPSPCVARVRGKSKEEATDARSSSKGKKELSIEINGRMMSSVTSPVRKSSSDSGTVQSRFDVKLQVNIDQGKNSTHGSTSSVEAEKSAKSFQIRHRGRNAYQRVPQDDHNFSSEVTLKKSASCKDYQAADLTIVERACSSNFDDTGSAHRFRSRSSSA